MAGRPDELYRRLRRGEYRRVVSDGAALLARTDLAGPRRIDAHLWSGRAELHRGRVAEALTHVTEASTVDPGDPRPHAWRVAVLESAWRIDEARAAAAEAVEKFPDSVPVLVAAGRLDSWRLDDRAGFARVEAALRAAPDDPDALEWYATGLRWLGRFDQALAAATEAHRRHPDVLDLRLEVGHAHRAVGAYDRALEAHRSALERDGQDRWALDETAYGLRLLGRWDEAVSLVTAVAERLPEEGWPHVELGRYLRWQGRFSEALAAYQQAVRREPGLPEAVTGEVDMLRALGREDDALARIEAALAGLGPLPTLRGTLVDTLRDLSRPSDALRLLTTMLSEHPDHLRAMRLHLDVLDDLGQAAEAERVCRRYCVAYPHVVGLRYDLAWSLADSGRPAAALAEFETAALDNPEDIGVLRGRARMLLRCNRPTEARELLESAARRRPFDAEFPIELGWLRDDEGQYAEALADMERALRIDPYDAAALRWRTILLRKLSRWREAEAAAAEALALSPDRNTFLIEQIALLRQRGRGHEVAGLLRRQLERRPGDVWLLLDLVADHGSRGRYTEALAVLDEMRPRHDTADVATWRISLLESQRRFAEAEAEALRAIDRFGRQRGLLIQLTTVYESTGRHTLAVDLYQELLDGDPDDQFAHGWRLDCLRDLHRLAEAETVARQACARRPQVAAYRNQLGWTLEEQGRYDAAHAEFAEAGQIDPTDEWAALGRARMLRRLHRMADAEAAVREALDRWPESSALRCELGYILDETNRFDEAVAQFDEVGARYPHAYQWLEAKSATLRSVRRFDEAERLMLGLTAEHPERQSAHAELGWVYRDSRRFADAVTVFAGLLANAARPEEIVDARCGLGWVALDQRQLDEAERQFAAAVRIRPHSTGARLGLAWVLVRRDHRERDEQAERLCRDVLAPRPLNHEAHTCLGVLNYQRGRLSVAEYHLRQAVKIDPHRGSRVDLGAFLGKLGRFDEAEAELRTAVGRDPYDGPAHSELGSVLLQRVAEGADGEPERYANQAAYHFRQARLASPESAAASLGLALALAQGGAGGFTAAETVLRHAIDLPESDTPRWQLRLALARLLVQQGDAAQRSDLYEEALDLAGEAISAAPTSPEPYFVAGVAEFKLAEAEATLYLRPWRRHRAHAHLRRCVRLDKTQVEARRVLRVLERARRLARPAALGSALLTMLATGVLATLWTAFLRGHPRITAYMMVVLTQIMVGLVALSVLLPLIVRLRLPGGVEADLSASIDQVSSGPTGEVSVGPGRLTVGAGPMGRPPRRE